MKFISSMYMPRRNFWCMKREDSSHLNFQLQKVDWGPSGRQNWWKTMEFWNILYIHFIRDPKGKTYVGFFLQIKSHWKMTLPMGWDLHWEWPDVNDWKEFWGAPWSISAYHIMLCLGFWWRTLPFPIAWFINV